MHRSHASLSSLKTRPVASPYNGMRCKQVLLFGGLGCFPNPFRGKSQMCGLTFHTNWLLPFSAQFQGNTKIFLLVSSTPAKLIRASIPLCYQTETALISDTLLLPRTGYVRRLSHICPLAGKGGCRRPWCPRCCSIRSSRCATRSNSTYWDRCSILCSRCILNVNSNQ